MDNEKIISGIKNKDTNTLKWIYRNHFSSIESWIISNSGTKQDAEDVFQDTMLIVYRQILNKDLFLSCSFKTYMQAISKNIWLDELRKRKNKINKIYINPSIDDDFYPVLDDVNQGINTIYKKYYNKLPDTCKEILKLYFTGIKSNEIIQSLNISNQKVLKTKIYKCKKRLIESIIKSEEYKKITYDRH